MLLFYQFCIVKGFA